MTKYEKLCSECLAEGLDLIEVNFKCKGLYANNTIAISSRIDTSIEKCCILAEELGHYVTTVGDILDQSNVSNIKQENRARAWAFEKLLPLDKFIQAYKYHCADKSQLIEFLDVTEEFFEEATQYYFKKYGKYIKYQGYLIYFEPLGVIAPIQKMLSCEDQIVHRRI